MTSKEALEKLNIKCIRSNGVDDEYFKEFNTIKKDLEVLEIIKTKNVDISLIKNCYGPLAYAVYNSYIDEEKNDKLTQEEFNLIKDVLEE